MDLALNNPRRFICQQTNKQTRLKFELAYSDILIEHINHYAMELSRKKKPYHKYTTK